MRAIESTKEMQDTTLRLCAEGRRIGFVPTMGFLHEGHLSLMRIARRKADIVAVSIFVNPLQFGAGEDFEQYPRDLARDAALCSQEKVDIMFCPGIADLYAPDYSVCVEETSLSAGLCGAGRPGHFRGVATVVCKLFNIVRPRVAVFGQKDAQQARVMQQMTRDLNFPVEIVIAPTVREPDGLAMSSRNKYLSGRERAEATCLVKALRAAQELFKRGERDARVIKEEMRRVISHAPSAGIEYIEIVNYDTFKPVEAIADVSLAALAVRMGRTRLIDNVLLPGADV